MNIKHYKKIKEGIEAWNKWRYENQDIRPDLSGADLSGANLRWANLSEAYLRGANLREANLMGADLMGADLSEAYLRGADLIRADLIRADLRGADLRGADLSDAIGIVLIQFQGFNMLIQKDKAQIGCESGDIQNWLGMSFEEAKKIGCQDDQRFFEAYKIILSAGQQVLKILEEKT